jgi:hypothetical protein
MRTRANVWAGQALLNVLTHCDVVPMEPGTFDLLQNGLVRRLAEDAAELFSMSGIPGVSNYHDEIRARLLETLPQMAERAKMVNRRRYLGDALIPDGIEQRKGGFPKANQAGGTKPRGGEPTCKEPGPAVNEASNSGTDRRKAVDAYIEEVFDRMGKRITRTDIWKSARYKSRTEFERWERNDHRATKTAHQRFTRILSEKPHLK